MVMDSVSLLNTFGLRVCVCSYWTGCLPFGLLYLPSDLLSMEVPYPIKKKKKKKTHRCPNSLSLSLSLSLSRSMAQSTFPLSASLSGQEKPKHSVIMSMFGKCLYRTE